MERKGDRSCCKIFGSKGNRALPSATSWITAVPAETVESRRAPAKTFPRRRFGGGEDDDRMPRKLAVVPGAACGEAPYRRIAGARGFLLHRRMTDCSLSLSDPPRSKRTRRNGFASHEARRVSTALGGIRQSPAPSAETASAAAVLSHVQAHQSRRCTVQVFSAMGALRRARSLWIGPVPRVAREDLPPRYGPARDRRRAVAPRICGGTRFRPGRCGPPRGFFDPSTYFASRTLLLSST